MHQWKLIQFQTLIRHIRSRGLRECCFEIDLRGSNRFVSQNESFQSHLSLFGSIWCCPFLLKDIKYSVDCLQGMCKTYETHVIDMKKMLCHIFCGSFKIIKDLFWLLYQSQNIFLTFFFSAMKVSALWYHRLWNFKIGLTKMMFNYSQCVVPPNPTWKLYF